jgi:ABC-2 type transport system ATP-binding protein
MFSSHQLDLVERLCDRVGIVKDGSMVAVGGIDALRSSRDEERRWVVDGPPPQAWVTAVPTARIVRTDGMRTVVEVSDHAVDDAPDQALLTAALAAGPVREFTPDRLTLAELFRDVVAPEREAAA